MTKTRTGGIKLVALPLFVCMWLSAAALASSFGIVYYGEPGQNAKIPQGTSENIFVNVYNRSDNVYVLISEAEIYITTSTGENTPSDWWEFRVAPPVENYQIWIGYEWKYFQANFFLPGTDFLVEQPQQPYPDNYDGWVKFSENQYALARRVTITVTASENVPPGEYRLHVPISGRKSTAAPGGIDVVTAYEAKPKFYVTGPPPSPSPPPPLPVWATILVIVLFIGLAAVLAYAVRKKKI